MPQSLFADWSPYMQASYHLSLAEQWISSTSKKNSPRQASLSRGLPDSCHYLATLPAEQKQLAHTHMLSYHVNSFYTLNYSAWASGPFE